MAVARFGFRTSRLITVPDFITGGRCSIQFIRTFVRCPWANLLAKCQIMTTLCRRNHRRRRHLPHHFRPLLGRRRHHPSCQLLPIHPRLPQSLPGISQCAVQFNAHYLDSRLWQVSSVLQTSGVDRSKIKS